MNNLLLLKSEKIKKRKKAVVFLFFIFSMFCNKEVQAQLSVEAGIPSIFSFYGFPKLSDVRSGFYVQTGYAFENHLKLHISYLRPNSSYKREYSQNAVLLGMAYVHEFKKVKHLALNYGVNFLYKQRNASWGWRNLLAVCPELKANVFVFKNCFISSSICMGYGKQYPYIKRQNSTNNVFELTYTFSLGIGYSFKPKESLK